MPLSGVTFDQVVDASPTGSPNLWVVVSQQYCRLASANCLQEFHVTSGDDAAQSFFLPLPQLCLNSIERLPKQAHSRPWLVQINSPIPVTSLRHHCRYHPSAHGEQCTVGHLENIIHGNSGLIQKRCHQTVEDICVPSSTRHGGIHGDRAQHTGSAFLCSVNLLQLRWAEPAVLGWEGCGAAHTTVVGWGQMNC